MSNLILPNNRASGVAVRQAISQGRINSSGFPNSISTTSGLSCTITASPTNPLVANFADGFDLPAAGQVPQPIDFSGAFTSTQVFNGLTASTTHYFYLERDSITGVVSLGRITIVPSYGAIAPTSPVVGQHWFKTSPDSLSGQQGYTMYEWNGSWLERQRVFLGEVTTGTSAVTSLANYSYNRRFQSLWTAFSGAQLLSIAHNLGMNLAEAQANWAGCGRANAADVLTNLIFSIIWDGTTYYGIRPQGGNRLNHNFQIYSGGAFHNGSALGTVGQLQFSIVSGW